MSESLATALPEFTTALACSEWLRTLPLINVAPSQDRLLRALQALNTTEIPADERVKILEFLLDAVIFLQSESARKYTGRAVPVARHEREVIDAVIALWNAFGVGYRICVENARSRGFGVGRSGVTLALQRGLWCTAQALNEHRKCYLEPSGSLWMELYKQYAQAEELGIATNIVASPVDAATLPQHCMSAVSQAVLMAASGPNELTSRQIAVTTRWLERWCTKAELTAQFTSIPPSGTAQQCLSIDLSKAEGPLRGTRIPENASVRFVDTRQISTSLRKRIAHLRKGESPASLGLGEDVPPQFAETLLVHLHRLWCEEHRPRHQLRRSTSDSCEIATGMSSIHFQVTGSTFRQPTHETELSKIQHDEIATFGRVSTRIDESSVQPQQSAIEEWSVIDESPAGLRVSRQSGESRFSHLQLVAVRLGTARAFTMASVRWLAVASDSTPTIGLSLIPGMAMGVSVRASGVNARKDNFVPALSLAAVPVLNSPDALVLPAGWFKPQRVIQIGAAPPMEVRLTGILDRGIDFERVTFEPV